jgi:RNA polymerase sigma-70 factor, ECF subfamily
VNALSTATPSQDLENLFEAHYGRIARVIGRVIHDQARAEELAVGVFLKWRQNNQAPPGWLYRVAVREAFDELRRIQRLQRFEPIFAAFRPSPPTPAQLHQATVEQTQVRHVLASIDRRQSALLVLWSEGLSYNELASALDLAPNYIGSLLSRSKESFRKEYIKRYGTQS